MTQADSQPADQSKSDKNAPKDEHKGSNANDPRVNVVDNPGDQQPEPPNPLSERRSEVPTAESEAASVNNRSHGDRPKIPREDRG